MKPRGYWYFRIWEDLVKWLAGESASGGKPMFNYEIIVKTLPAWFESRTDLKYKLVRTSGGGESTYEVHSRTPLEKEFDNSAEIVGYRRY